MRGIPRPLDMEQLVRCLEKQFGPVTLSAEDGYTKLVVSGLALTFLEAERLCLGEAMLDVSGAPDRKKRIEAAIDDSMAARYDVSAGWSSLVARWAHNPKVDGSNPSPATKEIGGLRLQSCPANPKQSALSD